MLTSSASLEGDRKSDGRLDGKDIDLFAFWVAIYAQLIHDLSLHTQPALLNVFGMKHSRAETHLFWMCFLVEISLTHCFLQLIVTCTNLFGDMWAMLQFRGSFVPVLGSLSMC